MVKKAVIQVRDTMIRTLQENGIDYICITDIARQKNPVEPKDVVKNWMRVKNTLEYLELLVLSQKMGREEARTPKGILRLNLPVGFPWNLNYT